MNTVYYPAVFILEKEGYSVIFPDTGQATCGDTWQDALLMAEDCLALTLEDENISEPSNPDAIDLQEIAKDYDTTVEQLSIQYIKGYATGPVKRYNITFYENLMQRLDDYATSHGITRSAALAEGAKQLLQHPGQELR